MDGIQPACSIPAPPGISSPVDVGTPGKNHEAIRPNSGTKPTVLQGFRNKLTTLWSVPKKGHNAANDLSAPSSLNHGEENSPGEAM
jgi:hypothetical protein